jgi:hypothetical protein
MKFDSVPVHGFLHCLVLRIREGSMRGSQCKFGSCVLAFIIVFVAAVPAAGRIVCGLNDKAGMSSVDFFRMCLDRSSHFPQLSYGNEMVEIANLWVPPSDWYHPRWLGKRPPVMYATTGGENAAVYMVEFTGSRSPLQKTPSMWVDEGWLRELVRKTQSDWTRVALFAHEFGHIYLGHVQGQGPATVWQQEYDADMFMGTTLRRLGASLPQAQALCYCIAFDAASEEANAHPSLRYRLEAVRRGWEGSRELRYAAAVVNDYLSNVTIEVEGKRYVLSSHSRSTVVFSDEATTLLLWECPPSGCTWSRFAIAANGEYHIFATGVGADLALKAW